MVAIPGPLDISDAWNAIVHCDSFLEDENSNTRIWTLPEGTKWMGNITRFYNRPCYDDMILAFSSQKFVLIKGTPGIGKTLFLQRVLVQLIRDARVGGRFPSIHYMRYANGVTEVFSFLSDGSVSDITGIASEKHSITEYLLSDSVDLSNPYGTVLNLEVASDKEINYNLFAKRIKENRDGKGLTKTMPLFSFEELLRIKPANLATELAQLRYDIYGGSARNFVNISVTDGRPITIVEVEMKRFFGEAIATSYPEAWHNIINDVSSLLRAKNDVSNFNNLFNSMMTHTLPGDEKVWASPFMHFLAAAIIDSRDTSMYAELKDYIGKAGLGVCFESLGHRKLLKSEKEYRLKPLLDPIPDLKPLFPLSPKFNIPLTLLRKISDISSLEEGQYGFPVYDNFPLVGAIIQPRTLIQFTTSPKTHKGATEKIEQIRDQLLAQRTDHRMVFIVPKESKDTFQYQKDLGDILQFMCFDDLVASDEILMSKAEEKKWMKCSTKGDKPKRKKSKTAA